MSAPQAVDYEWLETGGEMLDRMLRTIKGAQRSVRLEMYIFNADAIAEQFRNALVEAAHRGARVHVLLDALGSMALPESFWASLLKAGGQFRLFNP